MSEPCGCKRLVEGRHEPTCLGEPYGIPRESKDKRLEEMVRAWWAKWAVDLSSYSCGLGVHVEWAQDENEELVAMLRQVRREERAGDLWKQLFGAQADATRNLRRAEGAEARLRATVELLEERSGKLGLAEARLREVEAERDAALSGRQHEYLLRVEGERDELRAEVERLRAEKGEMALVLEQQNCTLTKEHDRAEKAEAALRSAEERVLHLLSHPGNPVGYTRDWVALIFKQERGAPAVVTTKPQHTKDCVETYNVSEGTAGCTCGIEP